MIRKPIPLAFVSFSSKNIQLSTGTSTNPKESRAGPTFNGMPRYAIEAIPIETSNKKYPITTYVFVYCRSSEQFLSKAAFFSAIWPKPAITTAKRKRK